MDFSQNVSPAPEQNSPSRSASSGLHQATQSPDAGTSIASDALSGSKSKNTDKSHVKSNSSDNSNQKGRMSTPTACLPCRSKHLKCDGAQPCSRCVAFGSDCAYIASRRGYKGPRRAPAKNPNKRVATSSPDPEPGTTALSSICTSGTSNKSASSPGCSSTSGQTSATSFSQRNDTPSVSSSYLDLSPPSISNSTRGPLPSLAERCFDSFYQNFHASHPFVLPKDFIHELSGRGIIDPLLAAMRWVGSLYIDVASARASLFDEALQRVYDPSNARDAFLIQAMMVLIVGLDGMCQQEKARGILGDVEKLAIDIALNTRPFAVFHGQGLPVLEESLRRTWWDLFVIDGMIAGVHRVTNFALFDHPTDVALPCEEHEYLSGNIPPPRHLEELEEQDFTDDDREFSSFAYRIICARNLGKFMRTPPILSPEDENLTKIEALLTNWRLHLPRSKRDALDRDGRLDEMMFQAHMMTHATSILLHQPHSQLDSSPAQNVNSCAPHQAITAGKTFNAHTRHTISSASEISKLITHRVPLLSHTHFFTCVVTLSSIIHLSKWALHFVQYDDDDLRQQIRLNIGALNELSNVWGAADTARGQVKGVAREIYQAKKQVQATPQFWLGLTRDQTFSSIAVDDGIIEIIEEWPVERDDFQE